jgi:hypothetical protein
MGLLDKLFRGKAIRAQCVRVKIRRADPTGLHEMTSENLRLMSNKFSAARIVWGIQHAEDVSG